MLLTIDVGNTETKLGCFAENELKQTWRVATQRMRTPDEYVLLLRELFGMYGIDVRAIGAIAIASVVPSLDPMLREACTRYFGCVPQFLRADEQHLIAIASEYPAEVGADLIAAAIGGRERFGAPLIVVSFGTATVFIAISERGEYLGAAIAPGITVSVDALIARAAKLPTVALETPHHAIGRNTNEALQSGIVYGFVGQAEAIVERMRTELGTRAKVVATGGLADVVAKQTPVIDAVDPHLSLVGLQLFHDAVYKS